MEDTECSLLLFLTVFFPARIYLTKLARLRLYIFSWHVKSAFIQRLFYQVRFSIAFSLWVCLGGIHSFQQVDSSVRCCLWKGPLIRCLEIHIWFLVPNGKGGMGGWKRKLQPDLATSFSSCVCFTLTFLPLSQTAVPAGTSVRNEVPDLSVWSVLQVACTGVVSGVRVCCRRCYFWGAVLVLSGIYRNKRFFQLLLWRCEDSGFTCRKRVSRTYSCMSTTGMGARR